MNLELKHRLFEVRALVKNTTDNQEKNGRTQ